MGDASAGRAIDTGSEQLLCRVEERVALVTLNRPEARNALTLEMKEALRGLLPVLGDDPEVGCVLLTGAGGAFCAGGDVKGMGGRASPPEAAPAGLEEVIADQTERQQALTGALYALPVPTIAALPGAAAGAGLSIALACDLRVAAESAFVTTGFANVGLSGDYGASFFLTQLVGTAKARELFFTGERVGAAECERIGIANVVVADSELEKESLALAARIASGPPQALRWMKDTLNRAQREDLPSILDLEADRMVLSAQTEDYLEAVKAFQEKRAPVFKGR